MWARARACVWCVCVCGLCLCPCVFVSVYACVWENNIKEWTGLEWNNILLRKAENREEWRKLIT